MPPQVIETTAEVVEEHSGPRHKVEAHEVPVYTVAKAVEWMKKPENAAKVERLAADMRQASKNMMNNAADRIADVKNLMVEIATDDSVAEDFWNNFLKSVVD